MTAWQERSPCQRHRTRMWKVFEQHQRVNEDIAFRMKLRWLFNTFHGKDFGQYFDEQT